MRAFLAGRSISTRETDAFLSFFFRYSRTLMSSASMPAKSRLLAYQRLDQLRLTARRKPVGWIFCPIFLPGLLVANRHVHMARGLADAIAATLGARGEALERGALLDVDGLDLQFVDVGTVVVLGVGDGRLEHLLHDHSGLLLRELQDVERLIDLLAADQVSDQTALVDRKADAAEDCTCFRHGRSLLLLDFLVRGVPLERARERK